MGASVGAWEALADGGSVPASDARPHERSTLPAVRLGCRRWSSEGLDADRRAFPEESPIAFRVNDADYAVMLASPADIIDFAYGFLLSEGAITAADEVEAVGVATRPEGLVVHARLYGAVPAALRRERRIAGVSSCGLCGVESLRDVVRPLARVADGPVFSGRAILRAVESLREWQPCNAVSGAMHAAAFSDGDGAIVASREDVGRHNALDKLIGALMRAGTGPEKGFVVMSSRCSYELIQKASAFGIRLLCTVSAPTALAVRLARHANLTMVSLAREDSFLVLAGEERIEGEGVSADG